MKSFQLIFETVEGLEKDLMQLNGLPSGRLLFQLSWSHDSKDCVQKVTGCIDRLFPDALYYGSEASGNIVDGNLAYGVAITCNVFEDEESRAELVWVRQDTEVSSLQDLWNICRSRIGLKAVELVPSISYLEILKIHNSVPDLDETIPVFGGASVNMADPTQDAEIIARGHDMSDHGMAAILYYGGKLNLSCKYVLGWKGLGSHMKVNRSHDKIIYELDGQPPFSVYEKYLNLKKGEDVGMVFPLIVEEDGIEFIRTPRQFMPDSSMAMIINVEEGSLARIAYGDKTTILETLYEKALDIDGFEPQSIKAYSCAGRKMFWGDDEVHKETRPLNNIAQIGGFYTGGEILRLGHKLRVMNSTLVLVGIREGEPTGKESHIRIEQHDKSLISRITHFVGVIAQEQEEQKKQLEEQQEELTRALSMAESSNRAKTTFLNNMSHDIRTPMNAIKGFTSMAKIHAHDREKVTRYLEKIEISSDQLLLLINQVLEMSRIESGKIELNEKTVCIKDRFNALVTILAEQAKENGLKFNCSLQNISHNYIVADEARMSQITMNIAGNAMKYTPAGGTIDFTYREIPCEREGFARYVFTVADNGIGMSEEYQKVIFEPFTREKNTTISKIQGTGLGMTIVKNLVDLMGGTITVQSELGKGSRFDITIDFRIDDRFKAEEPMHLDLSSVQFTGKRVLLVEDNEMNREIARFMLEGLGLIIDEADDGDIAVEKIRTVVEKEHYFHYDLVLMDIQMPRMDGLEATALIRRIDAPDGIHLPIIAMTANVFEEDRKAALEAGMDDHIAKPIDREQLVKVISKYL